MVEFDSTPHDGVTALARPDIFALTSSHDACPLAVMEAMAAARSVVATRVGGMVEQLAGEPLARLCDPTAASLAAAIGALLDERPAPLRPPPHAAPVAWLTMAAALVAAIRPLLDDGPAT